MARLSIAFSAILSASSLLLGGSALANGIEVAPGSVPPGSAGTQIELRGEDTHWDAQTTFSVTGGLGARIIGQVVSGPNHATVTLASGIESGQRLLQITTNTGDMTPMLNVGVPIPTSQVVCHGDSLTAGENASSGHGTATGSTYPAVLANALGPDWTVTNVGTGGWTIDQMTVEARAKIDALYRVDYASNILIVFGGTNNIGGRRETADLVYAKLTAYCAARKHVHPWKILVVTPPVAAYPKVYPLTFDTEMLRYDDMIRKNWRSFADGIIDLQADSRIGVPGDEFNPVYFNNHDFTHLTDAGYAIVGEHAADAIYSLLAPGVPKP